MSRIVLVSQSPRRRELLQQVKADFIVKTTRIEEVMDESLSLPSRLEKLSREKAEALTDYLEEDFVVGADTVVEVDGIVLGKAVDRDDAKRMLEMLSGRTHNVLTGVTIIHNGECKSFCEVTKVTFYPLSESDIEWYLDSEDWMDKAGSYAIQSNGALLVSSIEGDYNNIVGLPVSRLMKEIAKF